MLALISFTNWSYTSGSASRVQPLRRNPDTETNSGRTPLSSGFASHDCPPLVRPASSRHEVFLLSPALAGLFLDKKSRENLLGHDELQQNRWLCSAGGSFFLE
jgi:hypothetical protein